MNLGSLNEKGNTGTKYLLLFAIPIAQLGLGLQSFRVKLRVFETTDIGFEDEVSSLTGYHSRVSGEIQRFLEIFDELVDSDFTNDKEMMAELLDINRHIRELRERANFIDRLFADVPALGGS